MAEKLEIEVIVSPDGKVELTTHGLKGQACMAETEALEKSVGKVVRREKTREFYENVERTQTTVKGQS